MDVDIRCWEFRVARQANLLAILELHGSSTSGDEDTRLISGKMLLNHSEQNLNEAFIDSQ